MAYRRTDAVAERLTAARERLVEAAVTVVAQEGWAGASVTAVAAAAGMSAGSVYQHFPSKTALAVEVFRRASGRELAVLAGVLNAGTSGDPAPDPVCRLVTGVNVFARRALERRGLAYALLAAPAEPAVDTERLEFRRRYRSLFVEVVREGIAAGLLPEQDAEVTAAALTGAVGEVLVDPLAAPDPQGVEQLLTALEALTRRCTGAAAIAAAATTPTGA